MRGLWLKISAKVAFWLAAEIVFNCIGIDDLADYGEFVFKTKLLVNLNYVYTTALK